MRNKIEKIVPEKNANDKIEWPFADRLLIGLIFCILLVSMVLGLSFFVEQRKEERKLDEVGRALESRARGELERKIAAEKAEQERQEKLRLRKERLATSKIVALTFDDGPSSLTTGRLLDILKEKGVPATFFVLGNMAQRSPELVLREAAEGHEVASHTTAHINFNQVNSAAVVQNDAAAMRQILAGITGKEPRLLRPPYGNGINKDVVRYNVGLPMIHWSVDTLDWKYRDPSAVLERTLAGVHDGAIILMHDIHPTTVDAVPAVIDNLRAMGYEFATVPELAEIRGVGLVPGATYFNFKP